jgi:hypothetical protein
MFLYFMSRPAYNVLVKGRALARPSERSERFEPVVSRHLGRPLLVR